MCVLYEYLCRCAFVQRYVRGRLFVPQTVCPILSLSQSHTDSLFSVPPCLFPPSVCLLGAVSFDSFSPLVFSVCYLQPSCHISPLPVTFQVISEGDAYLCPERQLRANGLSFWLLKQWADQSKQTAKQEISMFVTLGTPF